jgi:hypothetical protein
MHPFGRYAAYFRIDGANLKVVRIVHGDRELDLIDFGDG